MRLIRSDRNSGIAAGLRHCLKHAKGEMTFWLDGDNVLAPSAIEVLSNAVAQRPDRMIFYSDEDILQNANKPRVLVASSLEEEVQYKYCRDNLNAK